MSISIGRQINAYQCTDILIDNYVVDHVEELSEEEDQLETTNRYSILEQIPGNYIEDTDDVQVAVNTDEVDVQCAANMD